MGNGGDSMRRSAFAAIALAGAMLACGGCQGNPAAPTDHSDMEATKAVGAPEERIATWRQHTEPVGGLDDESLRPQFQHPLHIVLFLLECKTAVAHHDLIPLGAGRVLHSL